MAGSDEKQPNKGAFDVVVTGYDAVYPAVAASPTFKRLWAQHACGGDFPAAFAHISFLTFDELHAMSEYLGLHEGGVLVDLACGAGGPGLWVASQSGASLIGIDPSATGLAEAPSTPSASASRTVPATSTAHSRRRASTMPRPTAP